MKPACIIHVKNMVCERCILIVKNIMASLEIKGNVTMGRITVNNPIEKGKVQQLAESLKNVGLEIIEDRINGIIEDIKQGIRDYIALGLDAQQFKLSSFISTRLPYGFGHLSDMFSKVEGITVERYFILQRMEKVKELISYDQLSLSEIAYETSFSSVYHLSAQFKKITGLTPSKFKAMAVGNRQSINMAVAV